ncbi:hypothetical protein SNEBB_005628 [Seison nebaliae]|nr:hypothetical protein SNEBB_005628 [Seison nebaliae]
MATAVALPVAGYSRSRSERQQRDSRGKSRSRSSSENPTLGELMPDFTVNVSGWDCEEEIVTTISQINNNHDNGTSIWGDPNVQNGKMKRWNLNRFLQEPKSTNVNSTTSNIHPIDETPPTSLLTNYGNKNKDNRIESVDLIGDVKGIDSTFSNNMRKNISTYENNNSRNLFQLPTDQSLIDTTTSKIELTSSISPKHFQPLTNSYMDNMDMKDNRRMDLLNLTSNLEHSWKILPEDHKMKNVKEITKHYNQYSKMGEASEQEILRYIHLDLEDGVLTDKVLYLPLRADGITIISELIGNSQKARRAYKKMKSNYSSANDGKEYTNACSRMKELQTQLVNLCHLEGDANNTSSQSTINGSSGNTITNSNVYNTPSATSTLYEQNAMRSTTHRPSYGAFNSMNQMNALGADVRYPPPIIDNNNNNNNNNNTSTSNNPNNSYMGRLPHNVIPPQAHNSSHPYGSHGNPSVMYPRNKPVEPSMYDPSMKTHNNRRPVNRFNKSRLGSYLSKDGGGYSPNGGMNGGNGDISNNMNFAYGEETPMSTQYRHMENDDWARNTMYNDRVNPVYYNDVMPDDHANDNFSSGPCWGDSNLPHRRPKPNLAQDFGSLNLNPHTTSHNPSGDNSTMNGIYGINESYPMLHGNLNHTNDTNFMNRMHNSNMYDYPNIPNMNPSDYPPNMPHAYDMPSVDHSMPSAFWPSNRRNPSHYLGGNNGNGMNSDSLQIESMSNNETSFKTFNKFENRNFSDHRHQRTISITRFIHETQSKYSVPFPHHFQIHFLKNFISNNRFIITTSIFSLRHVKLT